MTLTLKNTSKLVRVNGVPARVWEGETSSGIRVICFVTRLAVLSTEDQSQFERELSLQQAPSAEAEALPLRMVL